MKPQSVVRSRTSTLEREQFGESNPRVVFLPFSETLLDSAKGNTPCWQQQDTIVPIGQRQLPGI
jgi:hypothetical protein